VSGHHYSARQIKKLTVYTHYKHFIVKVAARDKCEQKLQPLGPAEVSLGAKHTTTANGFPSLI
jgi:hypothetical protein